MGIITRCTFCGLLAAVALSPAPEETTIRADVNLVQLPVTVTDARGRTVSGLPKTAFQLFVDNNPQPITVFQGEDAPVTAGIVIDNSSSMTSKVKEVVAAGLAFARASNPKDQMFVVHFTNRPRFGLPEGKRFTGDVAELEKAVEAFQLGGTTAFYDALMMAQSQLQWAVYPRKVLLTITDGGDNSSHTPLKDALSAAVKSGIVIYTIGLFDETDHDRNPEVLSKIAEETGGQAFFPERISDVTDTCVTIAREIRSQYTLGFPGAEDGKFHHIRVTATDADSGPLQVHARGGYFATKSPPNANRQK
jgi:Ca-activated chloride channel family protein